MAKRVAQIVLEGLDRRRFPWVTGGRSHRHREKCRDYRVGLAFGDKSSRHATAQRRQGTTGGRSDEYLTTAGPPRVSPRDIPVLSAAPSRGQFCGESRLGTRKADIVLGLWDGRVMPIECKVSILLLNSVKRLNNDAAVKAVSWKSDFGTVQVVPAAVLSGVYKLHNLQDAQSRGLTIFWSQNIAELIA